MFLERGMGRQKIIKIFRKGLKWCRWQICQAHILEFLIFLSVISFNNPRGQACILGQPVSEGSFFPSPQCPHEQMMLFLRIEKVWENGYTSKGRCGPVPKELCLRQTTPHSVYPSSPSFGWQQGSKKKTQQMLGRKRAWHNYIPKKSFKALYCVWSNSLNRRETFHPDQGWEFAIQAGWLRPGFCFSPSLSSGSLHCLKRSLNTWMSCFSS